MANTLNLGNGDWATKENSLLGYNSESGNYKPLAFDFTRASSATVVNKAGLIETAANGIPRIDFLGNTSGALKLEPQRTNLLPYSSDFSQWSLVNNITINPDSTMSPDGTLNASKVLEQVASANGHMVFDNLGLTPSVEYNFSIFVKKLNRRYVALQNSYNTQNGSIAFFDLDTETLVYTYSAGTVGTFTVSDAKIEKYNNGWYRLSANFQSDVSVLPTLVLADSQWSTGFSYNNLYTGDVTKGLYVYGAQVEQGSYSTSLINTSGSAVTRVADSCSQTVPDGIIGQTEGTMYWEGKFQDGQNPILMQIVPSSANYLSSIYIDFNKTINLIRFHIYDSGVIQATLSTSATPETKYKIALAYKQNDIQGYVNGVSIGSDTNATIQSGLNNLIIGGLVGYVNNNTFIGTKPNNVRLYNTRLSNAELAALTTI